MSEGKSWLSRLKSGLQKTSVKLTEGIASVVSKRRLDEAMLDELEAVLIAADVGVETAAELVAALKKDRFAKDVSDEEVREFLASRIALMLEPVAQPLVMDGAKPFVLAVVGVNGNGKTTTIGKLAKQLTQDGKKVMLAAADTFRAAAVEQLHVWGERTGCQVVTGAEGADPASVAFSAYESAVKAGADVLIVDTAGRLQNKSGLMQELQKILRVLGKQAEDAPHAVLLVLDATTGQNAHQQVEMFRDMVQVTGLAVTKLDGTAKAGVVVALAKRFGLPVHVIGVGEGIEDLRPFRAEDFARQLMGLA